MQYAYASGQWELIPISYPDGDSYRLRYQHMLKRTGSTPEPLRTTRPRLWQTAIDIGRISLMGYNLGACDLHQAGQPSCVVRMVMRDNDIRDTRRGISQAADSLSYDLLPAGKSCID